MKTLFTVTFLILYSFTATGADPAHGNLLKGTVKDAASGELLAGASVVLNDHAAATKTDLLGNFQFDNLHDGTYCFLITLQQGGTAVTRADYVTPANCVYYLPNISGRPVEQILPDR